MKSRPSYTYLILSTFTFVSLLIVTGCSLSVPASLQAAGVPTNDTTPASTVTPTLTTTPTSTITHTLTTTPTSDSHPTPIVGVNQVTTTGSLSQQLIFVAGTPEVGTFELEVVPNMDVNNSQSVQFVIHPVHWKDKSSTPFRSESIGLYSRMSVELIGGNFDIATATEKEQLLISGVDTTWSWTISPTMAGTHSLDVVVSVPVQVVGQKDIFTHTIQAEPIIITVNEPWWITVGKVVPGITAIVGLVPAIITAIKSWLDLTQTKKDIVAALEADIVHARRTGDVSAQAFANQLEGVKSRLKDKWRV